MIVTGDRPTLWFGIVGAFAPCLFLVVAGSLMALHSKPDVGLALAAVGLGGLTIMMPFFLRLCCVSGDDRIASFVRFRPTSVPLGAIELVEAEPFGGGSRVLARMRNGEVQTLILTPHPWWVGYSEYEYRIGLAVEQLRQAIASHA